MEEELLSQVESFRKRGTIAEHRFHEEVNDEGWMDGEV